LELKLKNQDLEKQLRDLDKLL